MERLCQQRLCETFVLPDSRSAIGSAGAQHNIENYVHHEHCHRQSLSCVSDRTNSWVEQLAEMVATINLDQYPDFRLYHGRAVLRAMSACKGALG